MNKALIKAIQQKDMNFLVTNETLKPTSLNTDKDKKIQRLIRVEFIVDFVIDDTEKLGRVKLLNEEVIFLTWEEVERLLVLLTKCSNVVVQNQTGKEQD